MCQLSMVCQLFFFWLAVDVYSFSLLFLLRLFWVDCDLYLCFYFRLQRNATGWRAGLRLLMRGSVNATNWSVLKSLKSPQYRVCWLRFRRGSMGSCDREGCWSTRDSNNAVAFISGMSVLMSLISSIPQSLGVSLILILIMIYIKKNRCGISGIVFR